MSFSSARPYPVGILCPSHPINRGPKSEGRSPKHVLLTLSLTVVAKLFLVATDTLSSLILFCGEGRTAVDAFENGCS